MSYELCKSITKKDNKIMVEIASNNVSPKTYSKVEYQVDNCNLEQNEFYLFTDILSGNIHLNSSIYNYKYAMLKAREYLVENNIDSFNLYETKSDYYNNKIKELIGIDLTSDYWKSEELKQKYTDFVNNNKKLVSQIRYDSYYKVYGNVYEIYKKALEEKQNNTIYTLYSNDYRSFIKCGRNGKFWYGYSSAKEKGKYKEMYCKMKEIDRCGVVMQRLVLTDKEIQKELENETLKEQAKIKIKDLEQVKKDITSLKNDYGFYLDKYYFEEICKLYGINGKLSKNVEKIYKNSYSFKGRISRKTSAILYNMRRELLEKVGV